MSFESLPLLIIFVLAVLGNNQSVSVAGGVLLIIKLLGLDSLLLLIESKGMQAGVTILTIAILAPLATGRISTSNIIDAVKSPVGIWAILSGLFVAWVAGRGLIFINTSPEIVTFLVSGTVLGVCFLQGVAIGPLIAGGLVSLVVALLK